MAPGEKKQPTKGQAVVMAVVALLFLLNNISTLFEGRPMTVFFWISVALDLSLLVLSLWLYRRAVKGTGPSASD
jgi:hypothetical protein